MSDLFDRDLGPGCVGDLVSVGVVGGHDGVVSADGSFDDCDVDDVIVAGLAGEQPDSTSLPLGQHFGLAQCENAGEAGVARTPTPEARRGWSMKRYLVAFDSINVRTGVDGVVSARVVVSVSVLPVLIVELVLLIRGLVDSLRLNSDTGNGCVLTESPYDFGQASIEQGTVHAALSSRQIETLLQFLLVYYRDGAAAVPHVDIEVGVPGAQRLDLVVCESASVAPIPGEEVRRLLGD